MTPKEGALPIPPDIMPTEVLCRLMDVFGRQEGPLAGECNDSFNHDVFLSNRQVYRGCVDLEEHVCRCIGFWWL